MGRAKREESVMGTRDSTSGDRPIVGPIRLEELDTLAQRDMNALIEAGIRFAAGLVGFKKGEPVIRLCEAIGEAVVDRSACKGLEIDELCEGKTGTGRVREGLVEPVRDVVDLSTRAILAMSNRPAIHEWVASLSVKAGPESNAIAVDKYPNVGGRAHVLLGAIGSSDRQVLGQAEWLKKGTRDDHSDPRADLERIATLAEQLGKAVPGPFHEHLQSLFEAEDRTHDLAQEAGAKRPALFGGFGVNPQTFADSYFPSCVILGTVPYGPPTKRGHASKGLFLPGDDEETVAVVEGCNRYGVARCSLVEPAVELEALDDVIIPELSERLGESPEPVPQDQIDRVLGWPVSSELRILENLPLVRYWWFPQSKHLLRSMQLSAPDGAEVLDVHLWRAIRLEGRQLRAAIALIERAHQPWTFSCIARFGREFEPGLAGTWKAVPREGLLRASLVTNAAGVCAHRRMTRRLQGY